MGNKDLGNNKILQICGIKDSILEAFAQRDFAQVMNLANLLEANIQATSASDFGNKASKNPSGEDLRKDLGEDFVCDSREDFDFSEDFINAGAKELGEFVSSAIAISALQMARNKQGISHITKQALGFAKIAQKAHIASQDKISQDSTQNAQNTQNDSLQNKDLQNNALCNESWQDKMAFYDLTLAKAYAKNGDVAISKAILQKLAKPFLDFESADFGADSSIANSSADSVAVDFGADFTKDSHIDENITGGGGNNTLATNHPTHSKESTKSTTSTKATSKQNLHKTPSQAHRQIPHQNANKNTPQNPHQNLAQNPIPNLNTNLAKEILCSLAEIHKALGELESAEKIYKVILHSKWILSEQDLENLFDANGNLTNSIRAIDNLLRLYEKGSEQKCLDILYEVLGRLEAILDRLKSTNEQIPYTSPDDSLPVALQPLEKRLAHIPRSVGKNDQQIKHLQAYINSWILPFIAFYLDALYRDKESLKLYSQLEGYNQTHSGFWYYYADALWHNKMYQQAYNAFQQSIKLDNNADALFGCGKMLLQLLETEEIYKEGLALYEHRLALLGATYRGKSAFSLPHYESCRRDLANNANALQGKVIFVYAEQGYGDTIMFAPALAKLCSMAKKVLFFPQSALFTLFDTSLEMIKNSGNKDFENLHIIGSLPRDKHNNDNKINPKLLAHQKESAKLSGYELDYAVPIGSLPFLINLSLQEWQSLPRPIVPISYYKDLRGKDCKDSCSNQAQNSTNNHKKIRKKIALFWHTNSSGNYERFKRDIPIEILEQAFLDSPYEIISFQVREVVNGKKEDFIIPSFMQNRGDNLLTWQDTYESLSDIDMIVSIDSALAHLGLVIGIPTLVLLPLRFDWRWGRLESPKSPFYPHAHLLVFDSNQHDEKMLKRNKSTIQNIRKICDKVLLGS